MMRAKSNPNLHQRYPVGMVVTVRKKCLDNVAYVKAVVYEHYKIGDDREGISLLFPNGKYDGFNKTCVVFFGVRPARFEPYLKSYRFHNVMTLLTDFNNGVFDKALK